MILSNVAPGRRFVVSRVMVAGEIGKRLADMGFTEGTEGEMIRGAFMRGPVQIRIRGYDLLIRRGEAACIEIELANDAQNDAQAGSRKNVASANLERKVTADKRLVLPARGPFGHGRHGFRSRVKSAFGEPDCCSGEHRGNPERRGRQGDCGLRNDGEGEAR